jgi:hypothetical protein
MPEPAYGAGYPAGGSSLPSGPGPRPAADKFLKPGGTFEFAGFSQEDGQAGQAAAQEEKAEREPSLREFTLIISR